MKFLIGWQTFLTMGLERNKMTIFILLLLTVIIFVLFVYSAFKEYFGATLTFMFSFLILGFASYIVIEYEIDRDYIIKNKEKTFTYIPEKSNNPFIAETQEKIFIKIIDVKENYVKYSITQKEKTEEVSELTSTFSTKYLEKTEEYNK